MSCGLASCSIDGSDFKVCDYNLQLRYDYNEENTATRNMIEYYVYTIDEYIFDERGILFQHRRFTPDRCIEYMHSQLALPPGRYSVIAVGNKDERSAVTDLTNGNAPEKGRTHRNDMRLTLTDAATLTGDTKGPCEKLYHGYRTFTVAPTGVSRVRVDMVNAHMRLRFRVTWKNGATPPPGNDYYALLETVPSHYRLMPQYIYPLGSFDCTVHDCDAHDAYPSRCDGIIHHIPGTCYGENGATPHNRLCHRNDTRITVDKEMWGEFTTYRVKMDTEPVLRIFNASDGTQIVRDINLRPYFEWYDYQPDYTLKQDYEIDIEIDGDKIILMPLDVADWDEGEVLKG